MSANTAPSLLEQDAPEVTEQLKLSPDPGEFITRMAEACKQIVLTDIPRALRIADVLIESAGTETAGRIDAMAAKGHSLCYANRFDEALEVLHEAGELALKHDRPLQYAGVRLASVQAMARLGLCPSVLIGKLSVCQFSDQLLFARCAPGGLSTSARADPKHTGGQATSGARDPPPSRPAGSHPARP